MTDETKTERVNRSGTAQFHFQAHGVEILIIDEVVMINGMPANARALEALEAAAHIGRQSLACSDRLIIELPEGE